MSSNNTLYILLLIMFSYNNIFIMHSSSPKFSFRNLQPIAYLQQFNRMIETNVRHLQQSPRQQLKVVPLTKFPLPQYYQDMEGIFQNVARKKADTRNLRRSHEQLEEQRFVQKHNDFMRKVLTKFIIHNENRQNIYQKEKKFVKRNEDPNNHMRTLSEPKLNRKKDPKEQNNPQIRLSEAALATLGSSIIEDDKSNQESTLDILPKLKPRKKQQKFTLRKDQKIQELIVSRKLKTNAAPLTFRPPDHLPPKQDENLDFKQQIVILQLKQVNRQQSFASKIEQQIAKFDREMQCQAHSINYCNFWRQPLAGQPQSSSVRPPSPAVEGRVDFKVSLSRYAST